MFIKLIICRVPFSKKNAFSKAQEKWIDTKNISGFLGQTGGWDLKDSNTAYIFSFWKHKKALDRFMDLHHDRIFEKTGQAGLYDSIRILHYTKITAVNNKADSLHTFLKKGTLMHITECEIPEPQSNSFSAFKEPFLGGFLLKQVNKNETCLFTGFWEKRSNEISGKDFPFQLTDPEIKIINSRWISLCNPWTIRTN